MWPPRLIVSILAYLVADIQHFGRPRIEIGCNQSYAGDHTNGEDVATMPKRRRLETGVEWVELTTTAADWKAADPALLGTMLGQLHLIRAFEETVLELAGETLVHGPAHSSIGQEGGAVGSIVAMRTTDAV